MAGVLIYIVQGDTDVLLSLTLNRGDIFFFIAVVFYSAYSVMLRKRPMIHPLSFLSVIFSIGSIMLLPFYLWETINGRPTSFNLTTVSAIGYTAIFPAIVSYFCYNRGVELIGAKRAGLFMHLIPVLVSIMAIVFLGESFRWFDGVSIILIAIGIIMTTRTKGKAMQ